jgi:hypothetical protein
MDRPEKATMKLFQRKTTPQAQSPSIYEGDRSIASTTRARSGAMMDRATQIYRNNPKTVGGAALLGAVALLGLVKNRGLRRV